MFTRIFTSSVKQILEYPMLIRIAFLTWFVHTISSFWRFAYTFYVFLEKQVDTSNIEWTLSQYVRAIFEFLIENVSVTTGLTITIVGVIWYFLLYPIGHAMMVSYAEHHSFSKAIKTAINRYFTVTIVEWILAVMTLWSWHLLAWRYFYAWDILDNVLVQTLFFLVGVFTLIMTHLYAYANISSVVDTFDSSRPVQQAQEALRNSTKMAMEHPITTVQFILLSVLLSIRFLITAVVAIAIPTLFVWLLLQLGILSQTTVTPVVFVLVGILLLFAIYINSIIDAFFTVYWCKLYRELQAQDAVEE